ncbi:hypothetical protein Tco_0816600 [Tanacetum coccineum]
MKKTDSDIQYAVSIKEDMAYLFLHFTKDHKGKKINTPYPGKTNTPYSSYGNKIFWKISNVVNMDDPNITMEEYIRLEEEKTRRRGKVYNWETAMYGKIWYGEDVHDLKSVETEFPAIVFNDKLTSEEALSCEPTVSPLNSNKIDFRISFDEFDDEDYTSSNIDEFDLKDETSLSEYDEEEQNVLYFNDLFLFNVIYPDDLSDKDNDNDKIDIKHSSVLIMEYLVKINYKACILELKRRNMKKTDSDIHYTVSIKEDTTYLCLHFTKDHEGNKINTPYLGKTNTPYSSYGNKIFWKISNAVPTPRNPR